MSSALNLGLHSIALDVEVNVANRGLPVLDIIGLPAKAVAESKDRVKTAIKNNYTDIDAKKVFLYNASANNLPVFEKKIDKIFTINSFEFWDDKINALRMVKKHMSEKGEIFIIHKILHAKGEPSINELGNIYSEYLQKSGFKNIKIEKNLKIEILCVKAVSR